MINVELLAYTPEPERLIAKAAKLCYSKSNISDINKNMSDEEIDTFIERLLNMGHMSPFEHATFTFGIEGISRSCSHQLVRHRIASYSQQSQRYVDMEKAEYVIPEIYNCEENEEVFKTASFLSNLVYRTFKASTYFYLLQEETGPLAELDPPEDIELTYEQILSLEAELKDKYPKESKKIEKKVLENARAFLPNATETKIIVTMNARSLMNFFKLRCCSRAQDEIRALANIMLEKCKEVAPMLFKNAGPECVRTKCPEGAMTCGNPWTKIKK